MAIPTDTIFYSVLTSISRSMENDKERMEFLIKSFKYARSAFAIPIFANALGPVPNEPALNRKVVDEFLQMLSRVRLEAPVYQHTMVSTLLIFQRLAGTQYKDEPELRAKLASGLEQFIEPATPDSGMPLLHKLI